MVAPRRFELMTFRVWTGRSNQLSYRAKMVERKGVEPSTSCVQNRRSSQMSYPPKWWRRQDLNLRPLRPKRSALPNWATSPSNNYTLILKKSKFFYFLIFSKNKKNGDHERIRTSDHKLRRLVLCPTELRDHSKQLYHFFKKHL